MTIKPLDPSDRGDAIAGHLETVTELARRLKEAKIYFKLAHPLEDATTLEVAVPGQRWEIDCYEDGTVEVEIFRSDGSILDEAALDQLIRDFSD